MTCSEMWKWRNLKKWRNVGVAKCRVASCRRALFTGGYKGYGLSVMIEIFCGILGGAHWGPNVRKWMNTTTEADLGQCFIAIDPEAFAPGFQGRLQDFMDTLRSLPTSDDSKNVEVAGDMERRHEELVKQLGGIPYHPNQITFIDDLAKDLGIKPAQTL